MIKPGKIQQLAQKVKVRDTQIEKDYVLTWILKGISQHNLLSKQLIFKGGTVLKKTYFEAYRYSEDLDFTLLEDTIPDEIIVKAFEKIFTFILEEANIPLEIIDHNKHKSGSINFFINYTGPLGGTGKNKHLKTDITRGEKLEFAPETKHVFLTYSDLKPFSIGCYLLEEILIEKMCALMGRSQPRDLYDLWYLLEIHGLDIVFHQPKFKRKAEFKGYDPLMFPDTLDRKLLQFKKRWKGSLASQIHELPEFDDVARELNRHIRKLTGG